MDTKTPVYEKFISGLREHVDMHYQLIDFIDIMAVRSKLDDYINESEHQDGYACWYNNFRYDVSKVWQDFLLYVKNLEQK